MKNYRMHKESGTSSQSTLNYPQVAQILPRVSRISSPNKFNQYNKIQFLSHIPMAKITRITNEEKGTMPKIRKLIPRIQNHTESKLTKKENTPIMLDDAREST